MSTASQTPDDRQKAQFAADQAIRRAIHSAGREAEDPGPYPASDRRPRILDAGVGMTVARDLELAAHARAVEYIRRGREAGFSWHQIGTAMHLRPGGGAQQAGDSIAEAAYTYATGHPDTENARRYGRSFHWTCDPCGNIIMDHGLIDGPAYDEHGHADNCGRHAAVIAAWDAQWEAGE